METGTSMENKEGTKVSTSIKEQNLQNKINQLETKIDVDKFFTEVREALYEQNEETRKSLASHSEALIRIEGKVAIHNNYEDRFESMNIRFEKIDKRLNFHDKIIWIIMGAFGVLEFLTRFIPK
jgi:predicted site-specific integrase-resolvase